MVLNPTLLQAAESSGDGNVRAHLLVLAIPLLLAPSMSAARQIEKVPAGSPDAQRLPEDLFNLPPNSWAFAKHLWQGNEPCTANECEAGYTSGELVVSVERAKTYIRVLAGFRGCGSVAWNDYEIGEKASTADTRTIGKRIKKTVGTSAKYCKVATPAIAPFDARQLYPIPKATDR